MTVPGQVTDHPPAAAFRLTEAATLVEGAVDPAAKTVEMHLIRPCVGRGQGRHLYTADMLREHAGVFSDWPMFVDHLSPEAQRALGGLPRSMRDLGGRVLESWWDPTVPADPALGLEEGAVVAKVRPLKFVRELIADDPVLVKASINARATSVRPTRVAGQQAWMVEGIEPTGSVDFVTDAGAGGRVVSLLEAVYHDQQEIDMALLESMTDQQFGQWLRDNRPQLLEALTRDNGGGPEPRETTGGTMDKTPAELIREALADDEGRRALDEIVEARVREEVQVEADLLRAEVRAESSRDAQLRSLRESAHEQIAGAGLLDDFREDLLSRYALDERGRPTPALDVSDELDADSGRVTRPAAEVLAEAVEEDIKRARSLIEAVTKAPPRKTRVQGQGSNANGASGREAELQEGGDGGGSEPEPRDDLWRLTLAEAGVEKPDEVYDDRPTALTPAGGEE